MTLVRGIRGRLQKAGLLKADGCGAAPQSHNEHRDQLEPIYSSISSDQALRDRHRKGIVSFGIPGTSGRNLHLADLRIPEEADLSPGPWSDGNPRWQGAGPLPHSPASATTGSMRVARRAGTTQAASPVTNSRIATEVITAGSVGWTP